MAAAAEGLKRVDQFVIVHFIDRSVDRTAAAIGVPQEAQNFVEHIAGEIEPRLESRRRQVFQKLTQ